MSYLKLNPGVRNTPREQEITRPDGTTRMETRKEAYIRRGMSEQAAQEQVEADLTREFGGGMSKAELQDFESLVSRLESSKMRQAAQGNRARQRDTFAGGLASMMGNF